MSIPEGSILAAQSVTEHSIKERQPGATGGGDTALDDALYLSDICEKVYLVLEETASRGAQGTVELLKQKRKCRACPKRNSDRNIWRKKPT